MGLLTISSAGSMWGTPRAGGPPRGPQGSSKAQQGAEEQSVEVEGNVDVSTDRREDRAMGLEGRPGQRGVRGMEAEAAWGQGCSGGEP